jgi:putative FmdB family regulatory protein
MPIYLYRCASCDREFEQLVRSSREAEEVRCPDCSGERLERLPTTFAVGSSTRTGARDDVPFCNRCGEDRPPCRP